MAPRVIDGAPAGVGVKPAGAGAGATVASCSLPPRLQLCAMSIAGPSTPSLSVHQIPQPLLRSVVGTAWA